jgi:hypothetical protein
VDPTARRKTSASSGRVQFTPWENPPSLRRASETQLLVWLVRDFTPRCPTGQAGWKGRSARSPHRSKRTTPTRLDPFQSFGD